MNWHETIAHIRNESTFQQLVSEAYLSADLKSNVERFRKSDEFAETLKVLFALNIGKGSKLLDVGAGNGISAIAFALEGFEVTALEPDLSDTVGAGAIMILKELYNLPDLEIVSSYGEKMPFADSNFDIVYARQCMHHAYNLQEFIKSIYRVVKIEGILLTIRDHVISDEAEKRNFLKRHPLHEFYGGENAFTLKEYKEAMTKAGFEVKQVLGPASSVINFSPWSTNRIKMMLTQKLGALAGNKIFIYFAWMAIKYRLARLPGRLCSIIARK